MVKTQKLWTNTVPGDERTRVLPVKRLTEKQAALKKAAKKLRADWHKFEVQASQSRAALVKLEDKCKHEVFIDERIVSFGEVFRTCALCGADRGMI